MNHLALISPFAALQKRVFDARTQLRPYMPSLLMLLVLALLWSFPNSAHAQEAGGMPWESALEKMAEMMTGAWVKWIAIIAIAVGGVLFGIGELKGPFGYALQIAAGFSVAIGAAALAGLVIGTT